MDKNVTQQTTDNVLQTVIVQKLETLLQMFITAQDGLLHPTNQPSLFHHITPQLLDSPSVPLELWELL